MLSNAILSIHSIPCLDIERRQLCEGAGGSRPTSPGCRSYCNTANPVTRSIRSNRSSYPIDRSATDPACPLSEGKYDYDWEYRAWAKESLKWASEATTPEERDAHIRSAEIWLQSALRSERLSKQPPATEYEWVLPPFQQWRRKGSENV
jgi:hypothetical protein